MRRPFPPFPSLTLALGLLLALGLGCSGGGSTAPASGGSSGSSGDTGLKYAEVYESGLVAPWVAATWSATANPSAPMPGGHAGTTAMACSLGPWNAAGFGQPWDDTANPPLLNEARTIEFDLYVAADSAPPDSLTFILNDAGQSDETPLSSLIAGWGSLTPAQKLGHWFHASATLAALHPLAQDVSRFLLFNNTGSGTVRITFASVRIGYQDRTTPPVIGLDTRTLSADETQLALAFHTDEPVRFHVDYGVGGAPRTVAGPAAYALSNSATLTGLTPGTTVQYRITAEDHRMAPGASPNIGTYDGTFAIPPAPTHPPVISNLAATHITGDQAVLGWTTDRPCTAVVTYQRTGGALLTRRLADLSAAPSLTLDLLEPASTYSVSVTVTDAFALTATATLDFQSGAAASPTVTIAIDPAQAHPISPYIYGNNQNYGAPQYTFGRMGGDLWTTYNWVNNACNAGQDWNNWNYDYIPWSLGVPADQETTPGIAITRGLDLILGPAAGPATHADGALITVPIQGRVAADNGTEPNADISLTPDYLDTRLKTLQTFKGAPFTLSPSPSDPHVYTDEYVNFVKTVAKAAHPGKEVFYSLDNEPDIWFSTHAVSVPQQESYDSFLAKEIAAAQAVKGVDPEATVFGFVSYGWYGYTQFQGSPDGSGSDFAAHGDFTDYYLDQMKAASDRAGKRLVDVLDLHYYTSATTPDGSVDAGSGDTSPAADAVRVQSTRSLWDPTYVEDSWITRDALPDGDKAIRLIPRMWDKIANHQPGTKLAITEYNFGGGTDISGALAQADALGIFGQFGLFAAARWELDGGNEPFEEAAFKMFRGFDEADAVFGDVSLPATSSDTASVAVYASRDSQHPGRYVLVAINRSTTAQDVAFTGIAASGTAYVYRMDRTTDPAHPAPALVGQVPVDLGTWVVNLPPFSVSTLEIR